MRQSINRLSSKRTLWLSILLHLLLLAVVIFHFNYPMTMRLEEKPALYIPSYTYSEPSQPTQVAQNQQTKPSSKNGIEKPVKQEVLADSADSKEALQYSKNEQGVHFIGQKKLNDPLIKLLGIALSAHLIYPPSAVDFRVTGVVHVGFVIHPNGQVTNIQILKSSGVGVLDDAAMTAATMMGIVRGVEQYLSKPKFIAIGIVFRA